MNIKYKSLSAILLLNIFSCQNKILKVRVKKEKKVNIIENKGYKRTFSDTEIKDEKARKRIKIEKYQYKNKISSIPSFKKASNNNLKTKIKTELSRPDLKTTKIFTLQDYYNKRGINKKIRNTNVSRQDHNKNYIQYKNQPPVIFFNFPTMIYPGFSNLHNYPFMMNPNLNSDMFSSNLGRKFELNNTIMTQNSNNFNLSHDRLSFPDNSIVNSNLLSSPEIYNKIITPKLNTMAYQYRPKHHYRKFIPNFKPFASQNILPNINSNCFRVLNNDEDDDLLLNNNNKLNELNKEALKKAFKDNPNVDIEKYFDIIRKDLNCDICKKYNQKYNPLLNYKEFHKKHYNLVSKLDDKYYTFTVDQGVCMLKISRLKEQDANLGNSFLRKLVSLKKHNSFVIYMQKQNLQ